MLGMARCSFHAVMFIFPSISPPTSYENEAASEMAKKDGFVEVFSINIMIYNDSIRPRFDPFPYHLKKRLIA